MKLLSYPKVYNMGHSAIKDLFLDPVVVQEKVDGSQFSFGKIDGELVCKSKGKDQSPGQTDKMFEKAVEQAQRVLPLLPEGWIFRAEYLEKPKHNTLCYSRIPKNHLILFDINWDLESYQPQMFLDEWAKKLDFDVAPMLYFGMIDGYDSVAKLLDTDSCLGGTKIEGIVFKNHGRFGEDGKVLMGKLVSTVFKEKHQKDWKVRNPAQADILELIASSLRTDARWEKGVQHLREIGNLAGEPKDIGLLIKEVQQDIRNEEQEYIKEKLYAWAAGAILKRCTAGLAEWYKDKLLKDQFD